MTCYIFITVILTGGIERQSNGGQGRDLWSLQGEPGINTYSSSE